MFGCDIGIDLGTASVLVYVSGRGIVLHEPSVVAISADTGSVMEVGSAAQRMVGRTPGGILAIRPLKEGVISDYDTTEKMLRYFIRKVVGKSLFSRKPRVAVCVPAAVTDVHRRAIEGAVKDAGARQVFIIEEPIAAAIGAGIDITAAKGSMILDIGGGTTDVAVIALGGIISSTSIKVAGDDMNRAITGYIRKKWGLLIGERTAEEVKINVGTAYPRLANASMEIRGRSLFTGLPENRIVSSREIAKALEEPIDAVLKAIHSVLEATPPELVADIVERGIVMTGGGGLLHGLDVLISERMGISAVIAEDAVSCVASGTGKYVEHIAQYNVGEFLVGKPENTMEKYD